MDEIARDKGKKAANSDPFHQAMAAMRTPERQLKRMSKNLGSAKPNHEQRSELGQLASQIRGAEKELQDHDEQALLDQRIERLLTRINNLLNR